MTRWMTLTNIILSKKYVIKLNITLSDKIDTVFFYKNQKIFEVKLLFMHVYRCNKITKKSKEIINKIQSS